LWKRICAGTRPTSGKNFNRASVKKLNSVDFPDAWFNQGALTMKIRQATAVAPLATPRIPVDKTFAGNKVETVKPDRLKSFNTKHS
jgi:hypothetical protein